MHETGMNEVPPVSQNDYLEACQLFGISRSSPGRSWWVGRGAKSEVEGSTSEAYVLYPGLTQSR